MPAENSTPDNFTPRSDCEAAVVPIAIASAARSPPSTTSVVGSVLLVVQVK